jgi:hypothetical protein
LLLAACSPTASEAPLHATITLAERLARDNTREPLDYAKPENWGCTGASGDVCDMDFSMARLETDGTIGVTPYHVEEDPKVDCFFIYPTVDFNVLAGDNHDDIARVYMPRRTIETQAGMFSSVCRVIAPYYRQGNFGAYATNIEQSMFLFKNAFVDVAAAFEYYLRHWNQGRPVVIIGHSQGAQMASYLLHFYFDGDVRVTDIEGSTTTAELRRRLVTALPVGFNVYVPKGKRVGGSFSDIPVCASLDEPGCVIHYRSFPEGYKFTGSWANELDVRLAREGYLNVEFDASKHEVSCVNPAVGPALGVTQATDADGHAVPPGDIRLLNGTYLVGIMAELRAGPRTEPLAQHLPGKYTATCRPDAKAGNWLAIGFHEASTTATDQRKDAIQVGGLLAEGELGLHLYDFNVAMGDLIEQVRRKTIAWESVNP